MAERVIYLFSPCFCLLESHLGSSLTSMRRLLKKTTFYFSNNCFSLVDINSNFLHVTLVDFSKLPCLGYLLFFLYDRKIIRQACLFRTYRREQMWQKLMSFPRNRTLSEKHERRSRNFLLQLEKTWSLISQILRTRCSNHLNISCSLWPQVKDKNKSANLFLSLIKRAVHRNLKSAYKVIKKTSTWVWKCKRTKPNNPKVLQLSQIIMEVAANWQQ